MTTERRRSLSDVDGDIHSDKHIELAAKARVTGSVYYKLIEMVLGAQVDGKLVHVADAQRGENLAVAPGVEPEPVVRDTQRVAQTIGGG